MFDPCTWLARKLFSKICASDLHNLEVIFSDGTCVRNHDASSATDVRIRFKNKSAEWRTIVYFYDGFIEGYIEGNVDIDGDLGFAKLIEMVHATIAGKVAVRRPINPLMHLRMLAQEATQNNRRVDRARKNAEFHYGHNPRFFEYMLGETVGYSEGLWLGETSDLNQANYNLYEYVCRKLRLSPGQHVVEVGSGWGYLPILMVKKYRANVTVYNPVDRQNAYMRERFARNGVADRIRIVEKDHSQLVDEPNTYDRFVSIGVHEHAGKHGNKAWIRSIASALKPGGIGIVTTTSLMSDQLANFSILKYVFPGGHTPSLPKTLKFMDESGLSYSQIENLWPHYRKTMIEWRRRLDSHWPEIQMIDPKVFDEKFRRRWIFLLDSHMENLWFGLDLSHITFKKGRDPSDLDLIHGSAFAESEFATGADQADCYR
jgi:cyclopropane-fatty-acyl-phospholipid synthase